jgi:mannose-6-phosphate isomerase
MTLVDGPFFRLDRLEGAPDDDVRSLYPGALLALPLAGEVAIRGADGRTGPGECLYAPSLDALDFSDAGVTLLIRPQ